MLFVSSSPQRSRTEGQYICPHYRAAPYGVCYKLRGEGCYQGKDSFWCLRVTDPRSRKVQGNITLNPEPLRRLIPHPNLVLQGLYLVHVGRSWFQSLAPLTMVYGSGFRATSVLGVNAPNCWFHWIGVAVEHCRDSLPGNFTQALNWAFVEQNLTFLWIPGPNIN